MKKSLFIFNKMGQETAKWPFRSSSQAVFCYYKHGRRQPRIFKHGTNIVKRGLKVLFSAFFCYFSVFFPLVPHWKRLNSAIFQYFLLIFGLFSVGPLLENFLPTPLTTSLTTEPHRGIPLSAPRAPTTTELAGISSSHLPFNAAVK